MGSPHICKFTGKTHNTQHRVTFTVKGYEAKPAKRKYMLDQVMENQAQA